MRTPVREVIADYIGGGWGKETPDAKHVVPARVIRGTDLDAVQQGLIEGVPFRYHAVSNVRSRALSPGDIVFEVSGGSKDQPVGRSLLLNAERLARFDSQVIPASFCKRISPDQTKVHPRVLQAHLELAWQDRRIVQWQVQSTGISNFNFESFLDQFKIDLPPLPVQQRIAGILSAYDELIENSHRRIKILEAMARALYREWFVHFRFPCHENYPRVASPLGEIPQGWKCVTFTEIADVLSGGTPKTDVPEYWNGEIPFFTPRDAPDCFYVQDADKHVTELGLSKCASQLYAPDTVFITARGTVGKVALPSVPMAMNQSCYALRGKPGVSQRFLFLMTLQQVDYLKTNTGGATFDTIVVDTFRRMLVAKPPHELIAAFTRNVDAVFQHVDTLQRQIQNLRRTRDLLLPRLLSGQIDLDVVEEDVRSQDEGALGAAEVPLRSSTSSGTEVAKPEASEKSREPSRPISMIEHEEVLCTIRKVFSDGAGRDRDTALRDIANALGYQRMGTRIREELSADFMAAVRRGIVVNEGGTYRLGFRSFADCQRDTLKEAFESAIGRAWVTREDAIRAFARWAGFARVGEVIDQTARSLINGLIREGRVETDGPDLIRRA